MIKNTLPGLILFSFMVTVFAAGYSETFPAANSKTDVCILSYPSDYKAKLTAALVSELNAKHLSVTVDSISNSGKYDPKDFGAVILLSAVQRFRPLPAAPEYIIKHQYPGNIVYYSTYTMFNFVYGAGLDKNKIDAITSASDAKNPKLLEDTVKQITAKTLKILKKE